MANNNAMNGLRPTNTKVKKVKQNINTGTSPSAAGTLIYSSAARAASLCRIFASSCHLNHLRHSLPCVFILVHHYIGAVSPVQKPIFQTVNALVQVNIRAQLIAGPAPGKLPPVITFQLVVPGPRFDIIKAQPIKLWIFEIFSTAFPPLFHYIFTFFVHDSSCGPVS